MGLTSQQVTADATYTVRLDRGLSFKRFNDAKLLVKSLNKLQETTATYDGGTQSWTVTLPEGSVSGLRDLQALIDSYGSEVTAGAQPQAPAGQPARKPAQRPQLSAWGRASGLADREDGDGYTAAERDAMGH